MTAPHAAHFHRPTAFNDNTKANARFSPLVVAGKVLPSIYAAASLEGALMESVLHDVPYPSTGYQHDFKADRRSRYHVSEISILLPLTVVDLTTPGLQAMGLRPSDLLESNKPDYPRTRQWAAWFRQKCPHAHGLHWVSRRFDESAVIVPYAGTVPQGMLETDSAPTPVSSHEATTLSLVERLGGSAKPSV